MLIFHLLILKPDDSSSIKPYHRITGKQVVKLFPSIFNKVLIRGC